MKYEKEPPSQTVLYPRAIIIMIKVMAFVFYLVKKQTDGIVIHFLVS